MTCHRNDKHHQNQYSPGKLAYIEQKKENNNEMRNRRINKPFLCKIWHFNDSDNKIQSLSLSALCKQNY